MSACSQCGTVVKPSDKFCNVCGAPIARAGGSGAPGAAAYGATAFAPHGQGGPTPGYAPGPPGGASGPQPPRCPIGHEIAPGASYCMHGHPIAVDPPPFAGESYAAAYGPPQAPAYTGHRVSASPYGTPPPLTYGAPPPQGHPPTFTPPPPPASYAPGFGGPGQAPGYGQPQGPPPHALAQPSPYAFPHESPREAPSKVLRGFLVAYGTNPSGDFWPLTGGRHALGRFGSGDGLDIALQDPTISSRHAAIVVDGSNGTVIVEDTGSTNGTFVNDEHIGYGGRRELKDGDRVRFGGFTTVVKVIGRV